MLGAIYTGTLSAVESALGQGGQLPPQLPPPLPCLAMSCVGGLEGEISLSPPYLGLGRSSSAKGRKEGPLTDAKRVAAQACWGAGKDVGFYSLGPGL